MRARSSGSTGRLLGATALSVVLVAGLIVAAAFLPAGTRADGVTGGASTGTQAVPSSAAPTLAVPSPRAAASVAVPDPCARTRADVVHVDLSEQRMWLCESGEAVLVSAVTTGADDSPTPTGRWRVYAKQTDRWLSGTGYSRLVDRWMPYAGGIGFHDSAWQRFPYGSDRFHAKGSHGCVHVPGQAMKRLYRWADVGTRVRVVV